MIDWLRFLPFVWKINHNVTDVRGPYFRKPLQNTWKLADNLFRFYAPRANPILGFRGDGRSVNAKSPGTKDILNNAWEYQRYGSIEGAPISIWHPELFCFNDWFFVGPWFSGCQESLRMLGDVFSADAASGFSDHNFFHPRSFESAVANILDQYYGYKRKSGYSHAKYRGPLDWQVFPISSSIRAVCFDVHDISGSKGNPLLERIVLFPASPKKIIQIIFNFGGTEIYRDEVRAKPMLELCDSIINSFKLEVGPKTQAEWDRVKETCPDMSLTENMQEFPWPLKIESHSKKPKEVDITPADTPPRLN